MLTSVNQTRCPAQSSVTPTSRTAAAAVAATFVAKSVAVKF